MRPSVHALLVPSPGDAGAQGTGGVKLRHWAGGALGLAVLAGIFFILVPQFADYRTAWDAITAMSAANVAMLIAAALLKVVGFAPPLMAALPGLSFMKALAVTQVSTSLTVVLPAGDAVGAASTYSLLRRWGFESNSVAVALALSSGANLLLTLLIPCIAVVAFYAVGADGAEGLGPLVLIAGVGLVAIVSAIALSLRSDAQLRRVGGYAQRAVSWVRRLFRKPPVAGWPDALSAFRTEAGARIAEHWWRLALAQTFSQVTTFLLLLACVRAVGIDSAQVNIAEAFVAWSVSRLATLIPITPGGLGFVELGLTGALVAFGAGNDEALAAALLARVAATLPTLAIGLVTGAYLGVLGKARGRRRRRPRG